MSCLHSAWYWIWDRITTCRYTSTLYRFILIFSGHICNRMSVDKVMVEGCLTKSTKMPLPALLLVLEVGRKHLDFICTRRSQAKYYELTTPTWHGFRWYGYSMRRNPIETGLPDSGMSWRTQCLRSYCYFRHWYGSDYHRQRVSLPSHLVEDNSKSYRIIQSPEASVPASTVLYDDLLLQPQWERRLNSGWLFVC